MTEPNFSAELTELLDALVLDRLTPEQHARLAEILESSEEARQAYFRSIDLHLGLKSLLGASAETDSRDDAIARTAAGAPASLTGPRATSGRRQRIGWTVAMVAAVVAVAALPMIQRRLQRPGGAADGNVAQTPVQEPPQAPTATPEGPAVPRPRVDGPVRLAQAAKAVLFGELTPAVGSPLRHGHEYALVEGQVELAFPAGATAILHAPAAFVVVSPERLDLRVGQCSVHAPEGAQGFEVTTPQTRVVDLGTRFSVKVHESGDSDVQVVEGIAEVHETEQPRNEAARLEVGEARRYSRRDPNRSRAIDFRRDAYEGSLSDRVISYRASKNAAGQAENLESLRVQRGGLPREYAIEQLIGADVTQFRSGVSASNLAVRAGFKGTTNEALTHDNALNTGFINPGASREPLTTDPVLPGEGIADERLTPGIAYRFDQPVVNSAGPDVVLFEIQSAVYPPQGDAFHIGPVHFEPGLKTHTVRKFDITMTSADALPVADFAVGTFPRPVKSLDDLRSQRFVTARQTMQFRALAVGIDLSDLGYPDGASVQELFLQDAADDQHYIDPVWIGGLPPVPADPATAAR